MSEEKNVSIATLSEGAAVERFDLALQDVLTNVQDVNTDWKKARTITMKVTIKSNEERDISAVVVEVDRKLAPIKPFGTMLFTGRDKDGKGYATEHVSNQGGLFDQNAGEEKPATEATGKLYKLDKKEVAN